MYGNGDQALKARICHTSRYVCICRARGWVKTGFPNGINVSFRLSTEVHMRVGEAIHIFL